MFSLTFSLSDGRAADELCERGRPSNPHVDHGSCITGAVTWTSTPQQQAIIDHDVGKHARILAGPGTGKSGTVIRLMERVTADGNKRGRLLTFTRAATRELEEKLAEQDEDLGRPTTVHSFAISTLLSNPATSALPEPIRIADDWEWQELIRIHLKALVGCDLKRIERAKAELASNWESLEPSEDRGLPEEIRNRFAGTWERHRVTFGYALLAELPFRLFARWRITPSLTLATGTTSLSMSTRTSTSAISRFSNRSPDAAEPLLPQAMTTSPSIPLGEHTRLVFGDSSPTTTRVRATTRCR